MHELGTWILVNTRCQYTRLCENRLLFVDLWSFHHLWSGAVLYALLHRLRPRARWTALLTLLLAYEILELLFIFLAFHAFRPETLKDQLTDIAVGMLGALICEGLARGCRRLERRRVGQGRRALRHITAALAAATVAFLWVVGYQYRYNVEVLNSHGLNWWAFSCWSIGLVVNLEIYGALRRAGRQPAASLLCTWGIHLAGLLVVEYAGYHLLGIREVGHTERRALLADVVHGTRGLFAFYLTAPVTGVACHRLLDRTFRAALGSVPADAQPVEETASLPVTAAGLG